MAEFRRRGCQNTQRISKATVLAMLVEDTKPRTYLESLDDDQWSILSFEPKSRIVCITVKGKTINGDFNDINTTLSVVLPYISTGVGDSIMDVNNTNI